MPAEIPRPRFTQGLSIGGNGAGARDMVVTSVDATQRIYFAGPTASQIWGLIGFGLSVVKSTQGVFATPAWFGQAGALANGCQFRVQRTGTATTRWQIDSGLNLTEMLLVDHLFAQLGGTVYDSESDEGSRIRVYHFGLATPMLLTGFAFAVDQIQFITNDALNGGVNVSQRAYAIFEDFTGG